MMEEVLVAIAAFLLGWAAARRSAGAGSPRRDPVDVTILGPERYAWRGSDVAAISAHVGLDLSDEGGMVSNRIPVAWDVYSDGLAVLRSSVQIETTAPAARVKRIGLWREDGSWITSITPDIYVGDDESRTITISSARIKTAPTRTPAA